MLRERVARFIEHGEGSFDELALAAFAFQFDRIAPFRRLCEGRGARPGEVASWRDVPPVPTAAFRTLDLAADPPVEIFRSSGTTGGTTSGEARSVHRQPYPELYRLAIDASFPRACLRELPPGGRLPILSLVPERAALPDSSLSFMAEHVLARWGSAASATAVGARGVEVAKARSWAASRQRDKLAGLVFATAFALADWLAALARQDLKLRLPYGTAVFETGGFKGRTTEVSRGELAARLEERLGIPPGAVVREYGMTELSSQCYTEALSGGDPDLFVAPPWVRVRALDPETLAEQPPGEPGLLAVFDLANLGSAAHVLTEDLGVADGAGFRLLGRAAGAELRGCSLTLEALRGGSPA